MVKNLTNAFLGRPEIEHLGIVVRVEWVMEEIKDITKSYPKLFNGLGLLSSPYPIRVKESARPYDLSTPRRIAILLLPKVREVLSRMESMDVIERVTEQTDWCSGMVVVPKANGKVRTIISYRNYVVHLGCSLPKSRVYACM